MNTIIQHFCTAFKPFKEIDTFSSRPGIYAFHFVGDSFPLESAREFIKSGKIIYIGKTESSQQQRDADTHFKSDQTGRSTVRRSIGAILREEKDLKPVSRNSYKNSEQDIQNFKFDEHSEKLLTEWMVNNLAVSYYECLLSPADLEALETKLINEEVPILNLAKNLRNPYHNEISSLRKQCVNIVKSQLKTSSIPQTGIKQNITARPIPMSNPANKYKLHEAMELVLLKFADHKATTSEISDLIWTQKLYCKKDGGKAMPSQIFLRAKNYKQFKLIDRNTVQLIHRTL